MKVVKRASAITLANDHKNMGINENKNLEIKEESKITKKEKHGLSEILSQLMLESDIDDAKLSRQIGVPASTISRMKLSRSANPTASTLRPLAKFFDVSISQLLGDEPLPENRLPGFHHPVQTTSSILPIIDWEMVPLWLAPENQNENQSNTFSKNANQWISSEYEFSKKAFALVIPTETFGFFFRKGSLILIDPEIAPKDGDLVIMQSAKEAAISLRQILMDGDLIYIRSVNPEIKSTVPLDNQCNIFGVIVETRFQLQESKAVTQTARQTSSSLVDNKFEILSYS